MRKIKFRAKCKYTKKFLYGDLLQISDRIEICNKDGDYEVIPETVGQYTEITDDYNMPIYEGDIVQRTSMAPGGVNIKGPVKFDEGSWWIANFEDSEMLFTEIDTLEIVGNIYE